MLAVGIDEEFIDVDGYAPRASTEFLQQCVQPISATPRVAESTGGSKQPNVGLISQVLRGAVSGFIVDDEELVDAEIAIMLEERRQAKPSR